MDNPSVDLCKGCSWCCSHIVVPLIPREDVLEHHANWGNKIVIDSMGRPWSIINKKCDKLDDNESCTIYENRPITCKQFPSAWDDVYALYCKYIRETYKKEK